jgi:hypothetical protein
MSRSSESRQYTNQKRFQEINPIRQMVKKSTQK